MTNPVLQSEGFERAAFTLARSLDAFGTGNFEQAVTDFGRQIDKLARIQGMTAANAVAAYERRPPVYNEDDFAV